MEISEISEKYKYACPEEGCNASYRKRYRLGVHQRKHTGERPFVCDIEDCTKAYTNPCHLKRHKCFAHEKAFEIMCKVAGCGQVFNNKYSLRKHLGQKHDTGNNMYKCAHCLQEFKKKRQLKSHLQSHTENNLKCSHCNIIFGSLHLYNKHKVNHRTYKCDCGLVFDKWTLFCDHRKKSCTIEKIDHKCIICNKTFTTKTNLKVHSLTHLEESQRDTYRCPYLDCKRSYKYKKNLNSHIAIYHEKDNDGADIKCTEQDCDLVFKTKKNLRQHLLNIHQGPPKKKKDRRPRKDKGKKTKCMAAILSGVPLPLKEHKDILNTSKPTSNKDSEGVCSSNSIGIDRNGDKIFIDISISPKSTSDKDGEEMSNSKEVVTDNRKEYMDKVIDLVTDTTVYTKEENSSLCENEMKQQLVTTVQNSIVPLQVVV